MRYAGDHKAQTRQRVLREAAAAIRAHGPGGVGVAALMARAGLTHGGFYAHWPSKDALLADAIDRMFDDGRATLPDGDSPADTLGRYVVAYLSMAHRDRLETGCPAPILAGEQHRLPAAARARFAAAIARMVAQVAGLLREAGVDRADERAPSAVAEMVGAVAIARALPDEAAAALLATARVSVRAKLGLRDA